MALILGTVLALLGLPAAARAAAPVVLVLGDSLSAGYGLDSGAGWVALLTQRLQRRWPGARVVNASISGDTSAGGASRLPALLRREHPDVLVLELGANDALQGLPLDATRANLQTLVAAAKAARARVLLLGMQIPPNYGAAYAGRFAALYPEVARASRVALVPFLLAGIAERRDAFQGDAIHPDAAAQQRMLDNVWPHLLPLLLACGAGA
jgi:acyl-CoA thioesterase-1